MKNLKDFEMGIGTWAWGDTSVWKYGKGYGEGDLREVFSASLESGVRFFDTAEVYGGGKSESFLGRFLREGAAGEVYVATKFAPWPWRWRTSLLLKALKASLRRLGLPRVDLYQMHWPSPPRSVKAWMEPLAEAVREGLAREVGVSNYDRSRMLRAQEALGRRGVALASNQVQYSLVRRKNEFNGLLAECAGSGVKLIAYSPLGMGMLSGKYGPSNPPSGPRAFFYPKGQRSRIQALVGRLRKIGEAHGGKSPNQTALNWLLCKGTLPIPGAKTRSQAAENAGALGWRLAPEEVAELDEASLSFRG